MIEMSDLVWLSGWLEGEGSFIVYGPGKYFGRPVISSGCTDLDVAQRAASILRCKVYSRPIAGKKTMHLVRVNANTAAAWMMTLYPLMGVRRQARIRECLSKWRAVDPQRYRSPLKSEEARVRKRDPFGRFSPGYKSEIVGRGERVMPKAKARFLATQNILTLMIATIAKSGSEGIDTARLASALHTKPKGIPAYSAALRRAIAYRASDPRLMVWRTNGRWHVDASGLAAIGLLPAPDTQAITLR